MIGVVSGVKVNQLNLKIMSVNVNYKNRMGYCTLTQGENKFKIWICHANCLFAMMYFYKDEKGVDMASLHSFLADLEHAKRCLKADLFKDYSNFTFVAKELNNDMWKFIRALANHGFKVTIK